jgi:hypothetical protein
LKKWDGNNKHNDIERIENVVSNMKEIEIKNKFMKFF